MREPERWRDRIPSRSIRVWLVRLVRDWVDTSPVSEFLYVSKRCNSLVKSPTSVGTEPVNVLIPSFSWVSWGRRGGDEFSAAPTCLPGSISTRPHSQSPNIKRSSSSNSSDSNSSSDSNNNNSSSATTTTTARTSVSSPNSVGIVPV